MTGFSLLNIISLKPVPGKIPRNDFPSVPHGATVLVLHAKEVPSPGQLSCILTTPPSIHVLLGAFSVGDPSRGKRPSSARVEDRYPTSHGPLAVLLDSLGTCPHPWCCQPALPHPLFHLRTETTTKQLLSSSRAHNGSPEGRWLQDSDI